MSPRSAALKPSVGNAKDLDYHLQQAKEGNEASFAVLLDYLRPYIDKILNSRVKSHECREDAAQDIYLKLFKKLNQYSGNVPLHHWVSRIAVNACTDSYHRKKRRREISFGDLSEEQSYYVESVSSCTKSEQFTECRAARDLLTEHLSDLKPSDQLVIQLLYLEGLSHREISERTGWTETLSKVKAFRARKRLVHSIRTAESKIESRLAPHIHTNIASRSRYRKAA